MTQNRIVAALAVVLVVYAGLLAYLGLTLSPERAEVIFGEEWWFEDLSPVFWLLLGAVLLFAAPIRISRRLGMAVITAALAAREEGWHKKFTTDSLFKSNYYGMEGVPLAEKLIAGAVALALTVLLLWLVVEGARELLRRGDLRRPWGWVTLFAVGITPLLKAIDRAPSILRVRFDVIVPQEIDKVMLSLEEGYEAALPLLFLVALALYLVDRRSSDAAPRG